MPRHESFGLAIRESIRRIARTPIMSASIVVAIALAVALNTAMVGIVRELMLDVPPALAAPSSLRMVGFRRAYPGGETEETEAATYEHYLALIRARELNAQVAAYSCRTQTVTILSTRRSMRVCGASTALFFALGTHPAIGRWPIIHDESGDEAAISYGAWTTLFGGDTSVVGRTIGIGDRRLSIVGVAQLGFRGLEDDVPDVWAPLELVGKQAAGDAWRSDQRNAWLSLVLRMRDGPYGAVAERVAAILRGVQTPTGASRETASITPIQRGLRSRGRSDAVIVLWLQAFSILVAIACCANVGMLLLIRVLSRQHGYAIKAALGATRVDIVQGPMLEAFSLTILGFVLGAITSSVAGDLLRRVALSSGQVELAPNHAAWGAPVFAVLAAAFALLAGIAPSLAAASAADTARTSRGQSGQTKLHVRILAAFGFAQAALCGYLLILFLLFGLSARNVLRIDTGLDVRNVGAVFLTAETNRGLVVDKVTLERTLAAIRGTPGVVAAAMTVTVPFSTGQGVSLDVPGHLHLPSISPFLNGVSPEYFGVVGTQALAGRLFTTADDSAAPSVAIISLQTARTIWGDSSVIGRCFYLGSAQRCVTVVGVVYDTKRLQLMEEPAMQIYVPLAQYRFQSGSRAVLAKVRGPMQRVLSAIALQLTSLPTTVTLDRIAPLEDMLYPQIRPWTLGAKLLIVMSLVAIWLTTMGLFTMLSFIVTSRQRELAIRIAIGAATNDLIASTAVKPLSIVAVAGLIGIASGVFTARQVAVFLYHTSWANPVAIGFAAVALFVIAVVGVGQPVWRALRIDPTITMRTE